MRVEKSAELYAKKIIMKAIFTRALNENYRKMGKSIFTLFGRGIENVRRIKIVGRERTFLCDLVIFNCHITYMYKPQANLECSFPIRESVFGIFLVASFKNWSCRHLR